MEVKLLVQQKAKTVRKTIFAGVSNNWADYTPAFPKGNPFFSPGDASAFLSPMENPAIPQLLARETTPPIKAPAHAAWHWG